jgi:predicted protein tyrosine phosphatase
MEILVFNEEAIQTFITDQKHIVISFQDPRSEFVNLPKQESRKGWFGVKIFDLDQDTGQFPYDRFLFTKDHAKNILDFINEHKNNIELICVNCVAGISRSAGCAGALSKILNNDDEIFFKCYLPNRLVYRTILEAYNEGA